MIHVLVVEDEARLRADLIDYLSLRGFAARGARSAAEFRDAMKAAAPDVVIMDVDLPDGDGFDLTRRLRGEHECGVVMLTAYGDADARIRGFESGADVYLVKHSPLREIEAVIRSLDRRLRAGAAAERQAAREAWMLDTRRWTLAAPSGDELRLTAAELGFLAMLMRQDGEPCRRQDLAEASARPNTSFDDRHLDALVSRLRKKIEDETGAKAPIRAAYGVGYAFSAPARVD